MTASDHDVKSFIKDAQREILLMKTLKHPNIIGYHDSFQYSIGGRPVFCAIMEYADGGDLNKFIQAQKKLRRPLEEETIMMLIVQLCFSLQQIHGKKFLHRDLKPANVFITKV